MPFEWDSNPASERAKTVHVLDRPATVTGIYKCYFFKFHFNITL
jgi:hypothetical protein